MTNLDNHEKRIMLLEQLTKLSGKHDYHTLCRINSIIDSLEASLNRDEKIFEKYIFLQKRLEDFYKSHFELKQSHEKLLDELKL